MRTEAAYGHDATARRRLGPASRGAYRQPPAITVAVALAIRRDAGSGEVARLSLVLSGLALLEVSVVLMATRRRERNSAEAALYDLDQSRRATAVAEDLRGEVERLHADLARLAAQTARSARRDD
jgi:hypothetical protein